jgi:predicted enzyme related to lactoylglutathione lyase
MDPVVHFEMPFDDQERVVKFYRSAFGWGMNALGEEMGHYILATTAKSDEQGSPLDRARINGGFFPKRPDWPAQFPNVVIAVGDVHAAMARVKEAGGEVLGDPIEIPGVGQYVSFFDTERNRVAILQPIMPAAAAKPAGGTKRSARSGARKAGTGAAKKKTRAGTKKVGASKKKKARSRR